MSEQLPPPDLARIAATEPRGDALVVPAGTEVLRVHPLGGSHPYQWDEFRTWGPTGSRFDHHPDPVGEHPLHGVMYVAYGRHALDTAVAEFHQRAGGGVAPIEIHDARDPHITVFELARAVTVLDLGGGWVTRAGGNQAINSGRRDRSRAWARAIHAGHPDISGVAYPSSIWGPGACIALWERANLAMPTGPIASRGYIDLRSALANVATDLGTLLLD